MVLLDAQSFFALAGAGLLKGLQAESGFEEGLQDDFAGVEMLYC